MVASLSFLRESPAKWTTGGQGEDIGLGLLLGLSCWLRARIVYHAYTVTGCHTTMLWYCGLRACRLALSRTALPAHRLSWCHLYTLPCRHLDTSRRATRGQREDKVWKRTTGGQGEGKTRTKRIQQKDKDWRRASIRAMTNKKRTTRKQQADIGFTGAAKLDTSRNKRDKWRTRRRGGQEEDTRRTTGRQEENKRRKREEKEDNRRTRSGDRVAIAVFGEK